MQNTCEPEHCKFHELLGGTVEYCPNFIELWWQPDEGEVKLIKDCAPKRLVLMMRHLDLRMLAVQKSNCEQRNESDKVMNVFNKMLEQAGRKNAYLAYEDTPFIEE